MVETDTIGISNDRAMNNIDNVVFYPNVMITRYL